MPSWFRITQTAGVGAAWRGFQLADDLHGAHLRAAGDGAAEEQQRITCAGLTSWRLRPHIGFDVVHMAVAGHRHQLC